ncbi:hypothetical protein BT96DRAFT_974627 [Gymnopus androsaceus JB14]|uniref:Protein kinase domain-containing protein n=1 Tax=Gymnopus androsaceus JB14 TaxID=1447944 RepID=A0A6A4HRN9_9AGAR|nr:hypothetical protein BT96DRAFT_974627 [Gymnopus androsaceus JB14]
MHFLPLFRQFLVFSSLSGAVLVVHGVPLVSRQGSHVFVRAAETIPATVSWSEGQFLHKTFTAAEKDAFKNSITDIKLDKPIGAQGFNNEGVYAISGTYKGHTADTVVVKFLPSDKGDGAMGWSEVAALTAAGDYVASGKVKHPKTEKEQPAIVMKKASGEPLDSTEVYKTAKPEKQKEMRVELAPLMCKEVAKIAATKHVYHHDNNFGNVLVKLDSAHKITSVALIDYGGEYSYIVKPGTSEEVLLQYCKEDWAASYEDGTRQGFGPRKPEGSGAKTGGAKTSGAKPSSGHK